MVRVVIGVGIGIRAEKAGENIAKPAGDVFGNGKQVVPGHGIVILPVDGEGDVGGVAGAVAVAENVGEKGGPILTLREAVEVAILIKSERSGIHIRDGESSSVRQIDRSSLCVGTTVDLGNG